MRLPSFVILCLFIVKVNSLHTVICISGTGDQPFGLMKVRCNEIAKKHPGTKIEYISPGSAIASNRPMLTQIKDHMEKVKKIARENPNGVNLIGYSLGALLAKSYIEVLSELKIHSFVSINGRIMGVYPYGPFTNLWSFFEKLIYWKIAQPLIDLFDPQSHGFGEDTWHDPRKRPEFKTDYLPHFNNLNGSCSKCKSNFLKVGKVYLIGSTSDGVCSPWFSAHGAFYDKKFKMVPLEQQPMYRDDTLGWKTLASQGRLLKLTIPNAGHTKIIFSRHLFEKYVTNYLQ